MPPNRKSLRFLKLGFINLTASFFIMSLYLICGVIGMLAIGAFMLVRFAKKAGENALRVKDAIALGKNVREANAKDNEIDAQIYTDMAGVTSRDDLKQFWMSGGDGNDAAEAVPDTANARHRMARRRHKAESNGT